jgi:hypothetical protein
VLAEGDPDATHVGTKGEVGLMGLRVTRVPGDGGDPGDDPGEADRRWLRGHGIDWDGTAG